MTSRKYHLLTGATGLLGEYLLRDLTKAAVPLAVVARPSKAQGARQRIDAIMGRWEHQAGFSLPRPVVFEGDLSQESLGLDRADKKWITDCCDTVIHNAASLQFVGRERSREPWLTNLGGTQQLLALCRETGIRRLHHVSTAYVAGDRTDSVLESELSSGQHPVNDYEASKIAAEEAIRQSDFPESLTVYRPGIIVGDSVTGYTSTFHGFYLPLRLIVLLLPELSGEIPEAGDVIRLLGLTGQERKHFVPVDWVSAAMTHIVGKPELHGRTYHLTPPTPVRVSDMADVFADVANSLPRSTSLESERTLAYSADLFVNGMETYRSYWRDDPQFACTNTLSALPHLPCPDVDASMMYRLARHAIRVQFTAPSMPANNHSIDVADLLPLVSTWSQSLPQSVCIQITGALGGSWSIYAGSDGSTTVSPGYDVECETVVRMNDRTLRDVVEGDLTADSAWSMGRIVATGSALGGEEVVQLIASLARGSRRTNSRN